MRIKQPKGDVVFDVINHILIIAFTLAVVYPLIYVVSASISDPQTVISGEMWLFPMDITFDGYTGVFENDQVWTGYANSLFYATVGTFINICITVMAAYPLARQNIIIGRNFIAFAFTFTMIFGGGMIPSYIVVRETGLFDTRWALIIPGALSVWNMLITRSFFFSTIPQEMYEAAEIDGAGDFRTFFRIVLPLSGTIIAVNGLFYAVQHWNAYFEAMIYLRDTNLFPLQVFLRNILILNQMDASMIGDVAEVERRQALADLLRYSLIVVASLPVMVAYPFVQKYFVKGVMIGSVKG